MEAAMVLLVAIAGVCLGFIAGKENAANDCAKLGGFEAGKTVFECRVRAK